MLAGFLAGCAGNTGGGDTAGQANPQTGSATAASGKVAILLPLSGRGAPVGQAMLDGAQLALFEVGAEGFELRPYDTGGTATGAQAAADQALQDGARLILGPLFGAAAQAVRPAASKAGINVISFSNNRQIAGNGVYILGLGPGDQVDRVVAFAASQGLRRIAALVPSNGYGNVVVDALRRATAQSGAQLLEVAYFTPGQEDPTELLNTFARAAASADAVMLAEGGDAVRLLAPQVAAAGLDPTRVKYLGTALWNDPGMGSEAALVGGWFSAPEPGLHATFNQRYQQAYGKAPHPLSTVAYDAVALAAKLSHDGFSTAAITDPNGFQGLNGIFRFGADGVSQRGLAVFEVAPGGPRIIDPAPNSFQRLGF